MSNDSLSCLLIYPIFFILFIKPFHVPFKLLWTSHIPPNVLLLFYITFREVCWNLEWLFDNSRAMASVACKLFEVIKFYKISYNAGCSFLLYRLSLALYLTLRIRCYTLTAELWLLIFLLLSKSSLHNPRPSASDLLIIGVIDHSCDPC